MRTCIQTLGFLAITAALSFGQDAPKEKGKGGDPEMMFKKMDTDSNGSVSLEEFKATPRAQKNPDMAGEIYGKMDSDSDGSVTLDEFKAFKPEKGKGEEKKPGKEKKKKKDAGEEAGE